MLLPFLQFLLSPRGRVNRSGFVLLSVSLMAIELLGAILIYKAGIQPDAVLILTLKAAFIWIALAACLRRTHDLGLSGLQLLSFAVAVLIHATLWVFLVLAVAGLEGFQAGSLWAYALNAAICAPLVAAALWMQLAPGEARSNAFGPVPQGWGVSASRARGSAPVRPLRADAV